MTEFNGTANENNNVPEIKTATVQNAVASSNSIDEVIKKVTDMNMSAVNDDEGKISENEAEPITVQPNMPIVAAKPITPAQPAPAVAATPVATAQPAPAATPVATAQPAPVAATPVATAQPAPAVAKPVATAQPAPAVAKPVATAQPAPAVAATPVATAQPAPVATPVATAQPAPAAVKPAVAAQPAPKPIKIDESSFSNAIAFDAVPTTSHVPVQTTQTATAQPAPAAVVKPAATVQPAQATAQPAPAAAVKPAVAAQPAQAATQPAQATAQPAPAAVVKPAATAQPAQAATQPAQATAQPAPAAVVKPAATVQPAPVQPIAQQQQPAPYVPYVQPYMQSMTPVAPVNQIPYYNGSPAMNGYSAPAYPPQQYSQYYGYPQQPVPVQPSVPAQQPAPVQQPSAPAQQYDQPMPQPQMPLKKKNYGAAVYITLIVLLMLFFIWILYDYGSGKIVVHRDNSSTTSSEYNPDTSSDTESKDTSSNDGVKPIETDDGDGVDPDGPTLTLNPIDESSEYSARAAFKRTNPSVVSVLVFENDKKMEKDFSSEGSGVIISANGYIVTNSHVILNSKNQHGVQVVLSDETVYNAKVVGFDTRTDLAVLKIKATNLVPANFADSDLVEIGEDVIALGNPGGIEFSHSLTKGIVSAVNRSVSTDNYVKYIQTDAAINPGNSGGPLLNLHGQVLGINTIKIVDEQYEGMGFAIPSRVVKSIVDDLITKGYVQNRVRLGIKGQAIDLLTAEKYGIKGGINIIEFTDDSAFAGSMAQVNDIIIKLGDTEIDCFATLYEELETYKPGDKAQITVYRPSEKKNIDITITLLADTGQSQN